MTDTPYSIVITNYRKMGNGARPMAKKFVDYIRELEQSGTDVSIRVEAEDE
jgi:hypothetical protein